MKKFPTKLLPIFLLAFIFFTANAQKLPKVQSISLLAPADIKIDGKTTEWNDAFQAYNPVNRIFYTISNDDNYLYFTARTDEYAGNEKVLFGGITFTIKLPAEKEGGESKKIKDVSITFPTQYYKNKGIRVLDLSRAASHYNDTTYRERHKVDSLSVIASKRMDNLFKEIELTGIEEIQEPSISINNSLGIKVAAQFNNHMQYVYELAIPLKYLGNSINSEKKFKYNIKMKGMPAVDDQGFSIPTFDIPANPTQAYFTQAFMQTATDFSGEYTLAKK